MIEVQPAVQGTITAKPGSIVAMGVQVRNRGNATSTYTSHLDLPEGWRIVTRDFPFSLAAGASDIRLISFAVPPDAGATQYDLRYSIEDAAGHSGTAVVRVIVPAVIQLQLEVEDAPRYVVAGTTFSTKFLLTNKGNSATPIRLRYRSSGGFPVAVDSTVLHFGPREVRQLDVRVTTDRKSTRVSHTLELEAVSGQDSTVVVRSSSIVEVVSRSTHVEEEYYEYPVTLRLREVGQDGLFASQAEAYGSASLSERHTDRLEFLLRGPETQTKSVLGQRDAYHVSYHSNSFDLYGGDLNYSLSTLTEFGRYATGGGGRATIGGLTAGGFYNSNRWSPQSQTEGAGFVNYEIAKRASVGLNYLQKNDLSKSDIATLRGLFVPFAGSNLDLEYGSGTKDGKQDNAFSLRLNGNHPWIGYDLRYVRAGPDFGGYYQDINFMSASVNLQATHDVRVESYARQESRNLARDTLQLYAPNDQYYQIGAVYSSNAALYYLHSIHQDVFPRPQYKREEDAVQGRFGFSTRSANVYLSGDYGTTRDEILNQRYPYQRLALNASYRPRGDQNYSASLEYTNGQDVYTSVSQERLSASLNAWLMIGQSTQAQLDVYASRLNTYPAQTYTLLEGLIDHVFPFGHKITFRIRESILSTTFSSSELAYSLEYTLPLGIPIKRITAVGQLRGRVIDENGRGMANVLINAGDDAALTDGKGEFFFGSLRPGSVFVTIDQASIGLDHISTRPLPIEIDVRGGEEAHLDLGVTRSVRITGTVRLFESKEQSFADTSTAVVDLGGKSGVFLELTNGTDYNRRVTDNRGRFSFADIRPGQWTLKVIGGDIPEYHFVDPDSISIDALPGETKDCTIELRPRRRTIKMLQEGAVIRVLPAKPEMKAEATPKKKVEAKPERNEEATPEKNVEAAPPSKSPLRPCIVTYDPRRKGYNLQVSSWFTVSKASTVAKEVQKITAMKAYTVNVTIPTLGKRTRVFVGMFSTRRSAEEMCLKLRARNQ